MLQACCVFFFSFLLVVLKTPFVTVISDWFGWYDKSDSYRKNHRSGISRLGGMAIFTGIMVSLNSFINMNEAEIRMLVIAIVLLFLIGLKDDFGGAGPMEKCLIQLLAAAILVTLGNCRLTSWYGVFFVGELDEIWSMLFSVILILFISNCFNLIDGIDGLAASIGLIANAFFGFYFFLIAKDLQSAFIALSVSGAMAGFLVYNARGLIFMGDAGALVIGLCTAVLAIRFIESEKSGFDNLSVVYTRPAISVTLLIVPVFDGIRICFIRILQKKSPFKGDRNHIHHRISALGFNDWQVVLMLSGFTLYALMLVLMLQALGNFIIISILFTGCIVINAIITYVRGCAIDSNYRFKDVWFKDTLNVG